jgi:GNAT superfamily N-acetyltransferase
VREITITARDEYTRHGEQTVRNGMTGKKVFTWPTPPPLADIQRDEVLIARIDGVVAGRMVLESVYHPFAELVNLEVAPQYRGRGVGSRLVGEAVRRAGERGFMAVFLQTEIDNTSAHKLYTRMGFLPTAARVMLRMVKFLNLPALHVFLAEHPLAMVDSRSIEDGWILAWHDAVSDDMLEIEMSGGSCQGDSGGLGPGIRRIRFHSRETGLDSTFAAPPEVRRGEAFEAAISVKNTGAELVEGRCRLLLNAGCIPADGSKGTQGFRLEPGGSVTVPLAVTITDEFNGEPLTKSCSYPSLPVCAEILCGDHAAWMCAQVLPQQHG